MKRHVNIPVFIPHLGCPHQCVFCDQRSITGREFDPSDVEGQIEEALGTVSGGIDCEIAFFGGSFTGIGEDLMRRLLCIAARFADEGRVSGIRLSTRPDYIDRRILSILAEYPVKTVELGIQSMDDDVLRASKRGHTAEQSREACRLVVGRGFSLVGQMMIGLPGADEQSEIKTAEEICALGASAARIYPAVVLKNTELEEMSTDGRYLPLGIDEAVGRSASVLEIFTARSVPVIRLGLCASDGLSAESAVGGAYHPAMGELVRGELYRRKIEEALTDAGISGRDTVTVEVPRGAVSPAIGNGGRNRAAIQSKFNIKSLKTVENPRLKEYNVKVE
ncbi:MAG: radical SAM protein [Eubacteriales bacterium]|jgi:histone acetyltransferase (RNA polymerase elongator complex component)